MTEIESLRQEIHRLQKDMLKIVRYTKPLGVKELSRALGRGRNYVGAMKKAGFSMPGGRSTVYAAQRWLEEHPGFRVQSSAENRSQDEN